MKKVDLFWKGQSKTGKYWLGVTYEDNGFMMKSFIQVTAEKFEELPETGEIEVPTKAL